MGKRHEKLGIKQTLQKVWLDKTLQMMLAGLTRDEIRSELDEYLSTQKQSGGIGQRGEKTYGMAISLLAAWFAPDADLIAFRNDALSLAKGLKTNEWAPLHWSVLSATYPFWFNVAHQTGRLLNLQDMVTQSQLFSRLKEYYGDRETVARNARYAVRSFVAWGILQDSQCQKGCYHKSAPISITDPDLAIHMLESALLAIPEAKAPMSLLLKHPSFFPFTLPLITGEFVSRHSSRIDIARYGLDEEYLILGAK